MSENIIELKNIKKCFDDMVVVEDFNLTVKKGEFVTFLGPSGCGKTTTLRMIAGFEFPTEGEILLNGKDISHLPPNLRPINTVFQRYALFPHLNVYDNVALPVTFDRGKHVDHDYIRELLSELGLWEKRKRYPSELSGGQQQRVALARALANKPALILADEPTGNLDSGTTVEVMGLLKESSRKYNQTILMVTHNEALAQACDRIIRIEDGKLYRSGKVPAAETAAASAGKDGDCL